jgi:erythromycin esterase-like protein
VIDAPLEVIRRTAVPVESGAYADPLLDLVADADVVLIGEASHGTHEFYEARAEITRALIARAGFNLVAVEADWPDAYRVNRWVRLSGRDATAREALGDFSRFPRWMWRNHVVMTFINWLRGWNEQQQPTGRTGFYGLDLYSLHRSIDHVVGYLQKIDPVAAARARQRYGCFDVFGQDMQSYGYASALRLSPSCEQGVMAQLVELRRQAAEYASRDGRVAEDEYFAAEQNARVVRNAESYYRAMFVDGGAESWNVRDRHMMSTLEMLRSSPVPHTSGRARAVVWAHNSHLGDARATSMSLRGELNLGQLVREQLGDRCRSVGFTTHTGTVTAASNWDEPAQRMKIRPSAAESYERLFHDVDIPSFILPLRDPATAAALSEPRLERAIGVIYRPESERTSHYFKAHLAQQFDAVIHIDETHALEPLETWARHEVDLPETYPTGI